ncbi:hypothetical protein EH240_03705 [Mesorhizobium tamadayense]|uniref:Uncharacterized protein n=1 Tax=Mesorhizobium tamadayense TaxID=425306 RepID=A0A3P3G6D9_9HYPH|nr:hypothetical protein [Mesorhizobium tamadayense]RRI06388.1 hypothetical protein EH240_03705 [Mesorhizobium tamadayense]
MKGETLIVPEFHKKEQVPARAFRWLIRRDENRTQLRQLLHLKVDSELPASHAALLDELDRREREDAGSRR